MAMGNMGGNVRRHHGPAVHRPPRNKPPRNQPHQRPGITITTITQAGNTVTITFDQPIIITGYLRPNVGGSLNIPMLLGDDRVGPTLLEVLQPNQIRLTYQFATAGLAYIYRGNSAAVTNNIGGLVFGKTGTLPG